MADNSFEPPDEAITLEGYRRARGEEPPPAPEPAPEPVTAAEPRTCEGCGGELSGRRQKFCTDTCKKRTYKKRTAMATAERGPEYPVTGAAAPPPTPAVVPVVAALLELGTIGQVELNIDGVLVIARPR